MVNPNLVIEKCCDDRAVAAVERLGLNAGDRAERLGLENLRAAEDNMVAIKDNAIGIAREFGELKLEVARENARLALEMEKCCCETRALIAEKANQTDALINRLENDRLKAELANLRLQLVTIEAVNGLPITAAAKAAV